MTLLRSTIISIALLLVGTAAVAQPAQNRSVGQFIDDTTITTAIKAKLTGDQLSNLTRIEVKTANGIVTLNGAVDSPERAMRAEQIASSVNGVRGVVNNIHVAGTTVYPPVGTPTSQAPVDATGIVAHVDRASGRITLQDGRVLHATAGTAIWQATPIQSLRPGDQVLVRSAAPIAGNPTNPSWRMGTVRSVNSGRYQIALTDGTLVRIAPYANIHRGAERLALEQIEPGSELVIHMVPPSLGSAEGSAFPGPTPVIEAADLNVVWTPSLGR